MDLNPKEQSLEEGFADALNDLIGIVTKLGPLCRDLAHLIKICQLGLKDKDQLHFLMRLVQS